MADAVTKVADGFSGGYSAIAKLDEAINFLTASEREHIRTLFEEGNASEARSEAFKIFADRQEETAQKARGPWSEAARSLGVAWSSFLDFLANNSVLKAVAFELESVAKGVTRVLDALSGASDNVDKLKQINDLALRIYSAEQITDTNPNAHAARLQGIQELRDQLAKLKSDYAAAGGAKPLGDTISGSDNSAEAKASNDTLHRLSLEQELQKLREKGDQGLTASEKTRREFLAGQMAAEAATGDQRVKDAERALAVDKETAKIRKESETLATKAAAERERAIHQFEGRVVGAEGGAGANPHSSASGFGQFTDGTWLEQFRKVFAEQAAGMSETQIKALRGNKEVAAAIIDNYARENARFLESFGAKVTAGNLYLAHFLGASGAKAVLQASPSAPVDQVIRRNDPKHADQVLSGNRGYLFDKEADRYRTAGELQKFIGNRVGDTGSAQSTGQAAMVALQIDAKKRQDELNLSVEQGNNERQRSLEALRAEGVLQDSALIAAQRKIAIDKAEFDLKKEVENLNKSLKPGEDPVALTQMQIDKTRELTGALFDLQQARASAQAKTNEVMDPVKDLTAERDALRSRIDYLRQNGDQVGAGALVPQLDDVNARLRDAIDLAIKFNEALTPETDPLHRTKEQIEAATLSLKSAKDGAKEWGTVLGQSGKTIAQTFASTLTSSIEKFARAVGEGKNVFKSLKDAFLDFAANFLKQIAQMILQQLAFNAAKAIMKALGVAVGGFHSGGTVGGAATFNRTVSPDWFAGAVHYHTGGIAGLRPDEVPTILQRGEEVLTSADPRHRNNGGMSGGGPSGGNTTVINVFDPAEALEQALRRPGGERTLINHVRNNSDGFNSALGR
jgi:hypothetical protein